MNELGLYFDGDLRRIYEVPADSSFTVNVDGYRRYVPDGEGDRFVRIGAVFLWSRYVDYMMTADWSTKALLKTGGALRTYSASGAPVYAPVDLRLINQWQMVPADYPHQLVVNGNLFPDESIGLVFDASRTTSAGVISSVNTSDAIAPEDTTLNPEQTAQLAALHQWLLDGAPATVAGCTTDCSTPDVPTSPSSVQLLAMPSLQTLLASASVLLGEAPTQPRISVVADETNEGSVH